MKQISSLPKPEGFFDPANPAGTPIPAERDPKLPPEPPPDPNAPPTPAQIAQSNMLGFANSDLAFQRQPRLHGQLPRLHDLRHRAADASRSCSASVVCPGGQGDVSVHGNLLFMSVEQTRGRVDCGTQGVLDAGQRRALPRRPHLRHHRPQQAEAGRRGADLPRLAHPHAGHRSERQGEPLCLRLRHQRRPAGRRARRLLGHEAGRGSQHRAVQHRRDPGAARRAAEREDRQSSAHLRRHGDRRDRRARTKAATAARARRRRARPTSATTSRSSRRSASPPAPARATASCSTSRDPKHPKRLDVASDKNFAYWHSATFNNDGTKVIFTDEWGGGARPRCRATDLPNWGADAIFDIVDQQAGVQGLLQDAGARRPTRRTASRTTAR